MLLWALLLQTVPVRPEEEPAAPALPTILDLAARDCAAAAACGVVPTRRYRLDVQAVISEDPKNSALRGAWRPCGITGAPVCPSKGHLLLRTDL
jgi:hypothetical protein